MTREELKKKQYDDKVKKGLKTLKFRKFKNFLFWLLGVVCMPIILVLTMFVGIKVIPMKVYFGGQESQYVSESISNKSILDAILSFNDYTFDELVFVEDLVTQLENTDIGDGKKLGDWVTFDTEKLKGLHFTEIASVISSCIVVNASLDNTIGLETLGDIDKIKAFSSWEKVPNQTAEDLSNFDLTVETCNPNLYWIPAGVSGGESLQSTAPSQNESSIQYEVAFVQAEDGAFLVQNGKYVLKNGAWGNLCYANISEVPFTVVLDIIDETLPRIALKDILSLAGINPPAEGENNILYTILGDKIIGDFSGDFKIEDFASGLTLENLGVSELLGELATLAMFDIWEEAGYPAQINTASENFNYKLYYYIASPDEVDENGALTKDAYELAFEQVEGGYKLKEGVDPYNTTIYYAKLSSIPFMDMTSLLSESLGRLDIIELLNTLGGAGITEDSLIYDILEGSTLNQLGNLTEKIDGVKLTSVMPLSSDNKMLYKILLQAKGEDVDNSNISELAEDLTIKDIKGGINFDNIYLSTVMPLNGDNKMLYKILLQAKGEDADDSNISELAKTLTIADIKNVSDFDTIKLSTVMPLTSDNEMLYKILLQAKGEDVDNSNISELAESLTIKDIKGGIDFDAIKLSTVLTPQGNLKTILEQMTGEDFENIKISSLSDNLSFDNIKLSTVVDESQNSKLFSILVEGVNEKRKTDSDLTNDTKMVSNSTLSIGDISDFSIDGIKLSTVLTPNANLKTILEQMTGKYFSDIKISTLSGNLQFDNIKLSTVIDQSANQKLFDILVEGINGKRLSDSDATNDTLVSASNLSISDISDFGVDNIKLSTVLTPKDNLKTILEQMTGEDFDNISISTLSGNLNFDNIYLSTVMPYNASTNKTLYSVLLQGSGYIVKDSDIESLASTLKISDIKGGIDFGNIRLSTVLTNSGDNDILDILLEDDTVTLDNIGEKINNLSVAEIYGVSCFVKDSTSEKAKYYKDEKGDFYLVGGALTPIELNGTTTYSISSDAKIWLFLAYEAKEKEIEGTKYKFDEETGNALYYYNKDLKFKDIASSITGMTGGILDATIRQLEDCGILTGPYNPLLYPQSISQIIDSANSKIPEIPVPQS